MTRIELGDTSRLERAVNRYADATGQPRPFDEPPPVSLTPYYQDDAVTIYHGDSRDILPGLAADAVVTDPPYGLTFQGHEWDATIPDWLPAARAVAPVVVFTTAPTTMWDYPRPDWVLNWVRQGSTSRTAYGGFNHWSPVLVYGRGKWTPDTILLPSVVTVGESMGVRHPSPKPVRLMRWLVKGCTEPGATVIDPFMGSGSTLVAAKDLGRKAIGIELDEAYCEQAARRCSQEVLGLAEERMAFKQAELERVSDLVEAVVANNR